MFAGFSIGAALGGLLAAALIPAFGWRSVFLVGGLGPLLLLPFLFKALPESIRFLAMIGGRDREVADLLQKVVPGTSFPASARFVVQEPRLTGLPVAHLFAEGRGSVTLLLWIVFFMWKPEQQALTWKAFIGPVVKAATLASAPKDIQDEVKEFWRPEYDQIGTKWKVSPPLGVTELSYAMERWDREVGADQVKK